VTQMKPDDHPTVVPSLVVDGADRLIAFLQEVFGASLKDRMAGPDNRVMHAEVAIGESVLMIGDHGPPMAASGGNSFYIYVDDVDAAYRKALAAGATSSMEPADQFYGHRTGAVVDPWGNHWTIARMVEVVSDEEMQRRMEAMMAAAR
jgi:PhnB protein